MNSPISSSTSAINAVKALFDAELNAQLGAMEREVHKLEADNKWLRAQMMKRATKGKRFLFVSHDVFDCV